MEAIRDRALSRSAVSGGSVGPSQSSKEYPQAIDNVRAPAAFS